MRVNGNLEMIIRDIPFESVLNANDLQTDCSRADES